MEFVLEKSDVAATASSTFRSVVWPHLNAAYSLARYIVGDPTAAEDITQEALLSAYRHFASLRGEAARPWLLAIVRNACSDYRRKNRVWGELTTYRLDEAEDMQDDAAEDPEAAAIGRAEIATLRAAIDALPETRRETLVLRELEELSYREISQITAVPIGTVMSRLARARADLGALLLSNRLARSNDRAGAIQRR
jgi:RNA polymerase sigma factor (sigma-70 family)